MALSPPTHLVAVGVSSPLAPPSIVTVNLPAATVGSVYTGTITAKGGLQPYTWSINSGALPSGLSLQAHNSTSINVAGIPTGVGQFTFNILCTDALQQTAQMSITMEHPS